MENNQCNSFDAVFHSVFFMYNSFDAVFHSVLRNEGKKTPAPLPSHTNRAGQTRDKMSIITKPDAPCVKKKYEHCNGCPYLHKETFEQRRLGRLSMYNERASWDGHDLGLTKTEYRVLHLLADNHAAYVTYRRIYDVVQSPGFIAGEGDTGYRCNVRSIMKRIRNKFKVHDPHFVHIENFQAVGYRLLLPSDLLPRRGHYTQALV